MMAAQLRGEGQGQGSGQGQGQGIATAFKDGLSSSTTPPINGVGSLGGEGRGAGGDGREELVLTNRAGESRSPYVRAHKDNPVRWQVWGDEAVEMARRENRLLFLSIGYSACHCE